MDTTQLFVTIGGFFFAGLFADLVGRSTRLPRVTLLLLCGLAAQSMGVIPGQIADSAAALSVIALTMVSLVLGGSLKWATVQSHGRAILSISVVVVMVCLLAITLGLLAIGTDLMLALLLAGIATATDPAATRDAIKQSRVTNGFVETLNGIVAVDDIWGLLAFSLILATIGAVSGQAVHVSALWDVGGAIGLGVLIGLPASLLTGRLREGEPLQVEALGLAFLSAGLASWLEVSFLITGITVGAIIANLAIHHRRAFHEIEHVQWPFMVLFFILAGASLDLHAVLSVGWLGAAYVVLRIAARLTGGWLGAWLGATPAPQRPLFGLALLPQAGVAIGMALLAAQTFPQFGPSILALTVGTTVVFEIIGPFATMFAIRRSTRQERSSDQA